MQNKNQVLKKRNYKTLRISDEIHQKIRIIASIEDEEIQKLAEKMLEEKISEYQLFQTTNRKLR